MAWLSEKAFVVIISLVGAGIKIDTYRDYGGPDDTPLLITMPLAFFDGNYIAFGLSLAAATAVFPQISYVVGEDRSPH